jgi:hypothetical protein
VRRRAQAAAALLLAAGLLLEAIALWLVAGGGGGLYLAGAAAAHLGAAGSCAEALRLRGSGGPADRQRTLWLVGWLMALAFPLCGPAGCAILSLRPAGGRRRLVESLEHRRSSAAEAARERKRGEQQLGAGIDALVDALKDRDAGVRIAAIDALRDVSPRQAVKLLSANRDNTVFDVRVRAVEGLGRISKSFGERIEEARASWRAAPHAPEVNRRLAELLVEYDELGLEDKTLSRALLEQAVRHAEAALAAELERGAALTLALALRRLGRLEEAEVIYRRLLPGHFDPGVFLGLAETQFLRRDFDGLAQTCRFGLREGHQRIDPAVLEAIRVWVQRA